MKVAAAAAAAARRRGSSSDASAPPGSGPRSPATRRGSRAEAALQAELARLGAASPASAGVLRRGFLVKKGHVLPTRKERYFVLGECSLSYYKPTRGDSVQLKGVLDLASSDVIAPMPNSDLWFRVRKAEGPDGKSYKLDLKASSFQERREWIEALRKACRGELLLRQRTLRSDKLLQHARISRRLERDPKPASELLASPMPSEGTPHADLRASFQVFHELVVLQNLLTTIRASWGPPTQWTMAQYQELVQSISLAQEKSGIAELDADSILAEAFKLRYQFEEIPENQRKLSRDEDPSFTEPKSPIGGQMQHKVPSPVPVPHMSPRVRCPTIHSYYSTFEELPSPGAEIVKASVDDKDKAKKEKVLTPRRATLSKYAHLYMLDDMRAKQPWSLERAEDDNLVKEREGGAASPLSETDIAATLMDRFGHDRIYTYVNHHTMIVLNPYRLLQTSRFTSIYDEQVVLTYAETEHAEESLAPHPFAIAKQSLLRLFFGHEAQSEEQVTTGPETTEANKPQMGKASSQSLFISGESGSGKTELAKDLLKYLVLVAQPALSRESLKSGQDVGSTRRPKVQLFTSSTKSTIKMRTEEARTMDLLEAKGVESYEIVLLDLHPERWEEMTTVSRSKRLPQVHIDGLFFGFYETLERLEDEEQLRMYFKNPRAAKKLSTVLDSNILLEAFGHATTSMNLNSSRFGKVTSLYVSFGLHPWEFQIRGCHIAPFLLEKSRVTSGRERRAKGETAMNFHVLYSMVAGLNAFSTMHQLAKQLHLEGVSCSAFAYLGRSEHQLASFVSPEETLKQDVERWHHIIAALEELKLSPSQQKAIFQVLSAVLWLGNIELEYDEKLQKLELTSSDRDNDAAEYVVELLGLESRNHLERMLMTRNLALESTGETFQVALEKGQVAHVRDTLARLLYQLIFYCIVAIMNKATEVDEQSSPKERAGESVCSPESVLTRGASVLKIVDVFGFEDLTHNSLDQLCINYLSEKMFAREEQIILAAYIGTSDESLPQLAAHSKSLDVLTLYEHPLGIFASLEELTILHQSENDSVEQEEKRNNLFVRNIYERNASMLPKAPRVLTNGRHQTSVAVNALPFVVPHSRGAVTYDATNFVKKNSDFVYASLVEGLEASTSLDVRRMLSRRPDSLATASGTSATTKMSPSDNRVVGSRSFVGQFRSQVHTLANGEDSHMPFYFHCVRPNANKRPSVADKTLVVQQVRAQRLPQQVEACNAPSSSYAAVNVPKNVVLARYGCLLPESRSLESVAANDADLVQWLRELLQDSETSHSAHKNLKVLASGVVQFSSIAMVERLEILREKREQVASAKIQALFLMLTWRRRYLSKKRERRGLSNELLEWYGPEKTATVKRLLKKYNGREDELRTKLATKKQAKLREENSVRQLARDLEALCLGPRGGLDARAVNEILRDETMRQLLQQSEKIVLALRDMSLNPEVLETQLADRELHAFYQRLVSFLQAKKQENSSQGGSNTQPPSEEQQISLDERVLHAASEENRALWVRLAKDTQWGDHQDALEEIGEDPELLLFHSEDEEFVATLERFLDVLEVEKAREEQQKALNAITKLAQLDDGVEGALEPAPGGGEDAEMLELLQNVRFDQSLMAAMSEDPYFEQALQNPVLMGSMQELMASPEGFATSAALKNPVVREFYMKLIALSFAS